uniref:Uncharacterized protein n=1 Tax=viral metagenome TaxID=1070528 RepID=A0A6C0LM71_9ZZZZ
MIGGKQRTIGSRAEVWHGTAKKTSGGLTKSHLMQNKNGRIVSRKKHHTAKKDNRLVKAGYGTKKGHFGYVMKDGKTSRKRGKKGHKGGMNHNGSNGVGSNSAGLSQSQKMMIHHNKSQSAGGMGNRNMTPNSGLSQGQKMMMHKNNSTGNSNMGSRVNMQKGGRKGKRSKKSRKQRGGMYSLNPSSYSGQGEGLHDTSLGVQFAAGNAG